MTAMSQRPRRRSDRRLPLTSAGLVSVAFVIGCEVRGVIGSNLTGYETDGPPPDPGTGDGDGAGDDTAALLDVGDPGIMSWGEYWCVRAEGATYDDPLLGTI